MTISIVVSFCATISVVGQNEACSSSSIPEKTIGETLDEKLLEHSGEFPLTIFHTNDLHTHFMSFNSWEEDCKEENRKSGKCWGGAASRLTAMNELSKEYKNVIKLDAGDQFQGTLWYTVFKEEPIAEYMNIMKYDAVAIGNHEFDDGINVLVSYLEKLPKSTAVITSNIEDEAGQLKGLFRTYKIMPIGGQQVGIVGCTALETQNPSYTGDLIFHEEIDALKKVVKELVDSHHINKIIVLSHSGYPIDQKICQQVEHVDIVVGGHTHTFLWPDDEPLPEGEQSKIEGPYPHEFENHGDPCLVVQASFHGKYLGRLSVVFDEHGKLIKDKWGGRPELLDVRKYPENGEIMELLEKRQGELDEKKRKVVGRSAIEINQIHDLRTYRIQECEIGNLIADAALYHYMSKHLQLEMTKGAAKTGTPWSTAGIVIWEGGTIYQIQTGMGGDITMGHVEGMLPYKNTLEKIAISGLTLLEALEHAVTKRSEKLPHRPTSTFLQVSGAKVVYDLSKPEGQRVERVLVQCAECSTPRYEPLDLVKKYYVIVPSYIAKGEDGFGMLKNQLEPSDNSNMLDLDVVLKYLEYNNLVIKGAEMRIEIYKSGTDSRESRGFITERIAFKPTGSEVTFKKDDDAHKDYQGKHGEVVGRTAVEIGQIGSSGICRIMECPLGNLVADAALYYYVSKHWETKKDVAGEKEPWSPVAIAIWNGAGLQELHKTAGADITIGDLLKIMPHGYKLVKIVISGRALLEALEHAVSDKNPNKGMLQVSGVGVVYDLSKPDGQRVQRVLVQCAECKNPHYEPLDQKKQYHVVTNNFLSQGGDGFTMLAHEHKEHKEHSEVLHIKAVSKYLQSHNPIKIGNEMRIEVYNGNENLKDLGYITDHPNAARPQYDD